MAIDIEKSFITDNRSVYSFLNQPGQGLYIPFYQREYSWDKDNVEQLLEDLSKGITRISEGNVEKEIRFLGTIITLIEKNRNNIYPQDPQAVPARIEVLIDGQQRLSTIAIIATLLTKQLHTILKKIKNSNPLYDSINEICDIWINQRLIHIFSFDLGRGKPRIKPKIIRGSRDFWTRDKGVDEAYQSELASYLGSFIQAFDEDKTFPRFSKDKLGQVLYQNVRKIENWLKDTVACAHTKLNEDFPPAWDIIAHLSQEQIWEFERPNLKEIIDSRDSENEPNFSVLCELVQVLSVCHFLLDRCCFTIIQPTDEDWAFDMFQSLNATGTPLTAIETFKPTVVNDDGYDKNTSGFKDSENEKNFDKIDKLFEDTNTAQQKNKRTSDFLTSFFIAYSGASVSSHFSYQRKMLIDSYNSLDIFYDRIDFIRFLGNYAEFYKNIWINYDSEKHSPIEAIKEHPEANLASMLLLFLRSSNHKMAITILASSYRDIIDKKDEAVTNFIETVKVVASFYALWRSSHPNSGLDAVYRDFFKKRGWKIQKQLVVSEIKEHFKNALKTKEIDTFDSWHQRSSSFLRYDNAGPNICRLALLTSAHDTIIDKSSPGLMKAGRNSTSKYLCLEEWNSPSLKTIEHIAPQTNTGNNWDPALYEESTFLYQSIGNLTLLPQNINSSAGNKSWKEKYLYFNCIAETDPLKVQEVNSLAMSLGVSLNETTVSLLQKSCYGKHIKPLIELGQDSEWNASIVKNRSERILELFWNRISPWLFQ